MAFRFQIISDLHLEFFKHAKFPKIPKNAEYLFITGCNLTIILHIYS